MDTNVIRKITIQSQIVGAAQTIGSLNDISTAQNKVIASSSAYDAALQKQQRSLTLASQQYAQLASAQNAVALAVTQQSQGLNAAAAANDNYASSSSHVGDALRLATKAVIEHTASYLETAGAIGAGVLVFGTLLAVLGPIVIAYKLVKGAIDLTTEAWDLGTAALKAYVDIATKAASLDLSTSFFQKITKGATDAKDSLDDITKAFTTLQKQSADTLGGSPLQTRVDASVKAGNFQGNTGVSQLAEANTTEEKYAAIVTLIDQAVAAGQRLAAIDIANTAFGPEAAANLRKDSDYFDKLNAAAAKISETQIVSPDDVGRALDLQNRYDAAVTILEQRWHPIQDVLTAGGVRMHEIWVEIVEDIANAVDGAAKLIEQLNKAPSWFQSGLNSVGNAITAMTTSPESRASAEQSYGISSNPADIAATAAANSYADAVTRLGAGLKNVNAVQQAVAATNAVQNGVWKDTSHAIDATTKSAGDANDAVDRAINTLQRHVLQQQADTQAIGLGDGALASFRAQAAETAAVQANGGEETAKQAAAFAVLKQAAADAADALAKAKVANDIKFNSSTSLLSSTDVQIATQLKSIYPNVTDALNSAEAAQIRFNDATKELSSGIQNDLVSGLTDITTGAKSAGQGFSDMGAAIVKTLEQMIIKFSIVNPLAQALQTSLGGGSSLLNLLGIGDANPGSSANPLPGLTAADYGAGFADGGYTGPGGRNEPAGIVHRGEYVIDAETTNRIGLAALNGLRGYASGGYVSSPAQVPASARNTQGSTAPVFNVVIENSSDAQVSASKPKQNSSGGFDIGVAVRKAVDNNIANGFHDKSMKARFGATPVGQRR